MNYTLTIAASAVRELERLSKEVAVRIDALSQDPRPRGSVKLAGTKDTWRVRVGDYRVVYTVDDAKRIVDVVRIRHRRDAYQ